MLGRPLLLGLECVCSHSPSPTENQKKITSLTGNKVSFGTVYAPNIAVTYVVDSYPRFAAESLVLINVFKNIVAFVFIFVAVNWIEADGFLQVYMILFMLVCVSILLAIPLYFYGRRWRLAASKSTRHNWFL